MSSDGVHADPKDVRKLARALQDFELKITEISRQGQRAIDSANWHDRQKEQFAARYRDFNRQTSRFIGNEVKQMVKQLDQLARDLEQAQSRRFG
jgi:hypothetical protein